MILDETSREEEINGNNNDEASNFHQNLRLGGFLMTPTNAALNSGTSRGKRMLMLP